MANTVELYTEHAKTCDMATGSTIEQELIVCRIDGETGECVKHDLGYDGQTTEIRCEGCDDLLWTAGEDA